MTGPVLRGLSAKYQALVALRGARDEHGGRDPDPARTRAELRRLSAHYPGCLRELDRLSLTALEARLADVRATLTTAQNPPPWLTWMAAYHAWLEIALWLKQALAADPRAAHDALATSAKERFALTVDPAFVAAVAQPPGGRLVATVFTRLERVFAVPSAVLSETLFPARPHGKAAPHHGC